MHLSSTLGDDPVLTINTKRMSSIICDDRFAVLVELSSTLKSLNGRTALARPNPDARGLINAKSPVTLINNAIISTTSLRKTISGGRNDRTDVRGVGDLVLIYLEPFVLKASIYYIHIIGITLR